MAINKNHLALSALCFLLFASLGCTAPGGSQPRAFWVQGWESLVGVALMAVVLLLSLGYMAATFMHDDRLRAWVGRELGQVFFSAVIIVIAVALVGSLDSWMRLISLASSDPGWQSYVNNGVCCPQGGQCALPPDSNPRGRACHIELATDYLQILYETARHSASTQLSNYGWFAFLSRMSISTTIVMKFMAGLSFSPFAGLELAAELFGLLFDLTIKTMFLIRAQQMFLDFLWYPLFPVMISMGLVLRILYFTRKLGGMLIAIALALYLVFPMFYVLSNAILWGFMQHPVAYSWSHFGNTYSEPGAGGEALPTYGADPILPPQQKAKDVFANDALKLDLCSSASTGEQNQMITAMDEVKGNFNAFQGGKWYSQFLGFVLNFADPTQPSMFGQNGPIATLAILMVFTIFIPFLALMTSLSAFKVLSPLMGGDVEIALLSRLI